jgi:tetratricopeptide (TPR) repeat protein
MRSGKLLISLAISLTLAGCSGLTSTESAPTPTAKAPQTKPAPPVTPPQPPRQPPQPSTSGAWQPLLQKAEQAAARGDYEQALALLERAQRIEPAAGVIYLEQAQVHRARGDMAQARSTAERGLLYCNSSQQCDALRGFSR